MAPDPSQNAKETHPLKAGDRMGVYEIIAPLGSGGMGLVYQARDTKLERLVALKFLRGADRDGDSVETLLLREARSASALNHPHIATIYEVGESDGRAYIAMELVEGRPLSAVLERDSLAPETAVRYGLEIAAALAQAHDRGIVHRDLKPANVMITTAGSVKVLDFAFFDLFVAMGKPIWAIPALFVVTIVVAALLGHLVASLYSEPMNRRLRSRWGENRLGTVMDTDSSVPPEGRLAV